MTIDNRKSKKEIKDKLKKVEDLNLEDTPKKEPVETPEEEPEEVIEEEPTTPEKPEDVEPEPAKDEDEEPIVDYKEKFTASTREAQVLTAKNKKLTEIIDKASELPEPTEDEIKSEYPDWETLSDFEKKIAKDNLLNKRKFNLVHQAVQETKKIDEWVDKVDQFVEEASANDKFPELEGKEDNFRRFCLKPTRRGVDFEDLVKAFLFDVQPLAKHKGSLLETGTGGPKEIEKPHELTAEEVKKIRLTDHRKYRQLIRARKIKIEM